MHNCRRPRVRARRQPGPAGRGQTPPEYTLPTACAKGFAARVIPTSWRPPARRSVSRASIFFAQSPAAW